LSRARQRGIAMLVAIIMFAICTALAVTITYNKAMAARRAAATFTMEQALEAGMAAEALANIAIEQDGASSKTDTTQEWAQAVGPLEIEGTGVWITAQVEDLSGRFNVNRLVAWNAQTHQFEEDPRQVKVFKALLASLDIEDRWADFLVDWIDTDIAPNPLQGGEDSLYLSQNPPYRPPNTFITHPSEILAMPGFGAERYKKLAPHITALPVDSKLNVCTATGKVLDAWRIELSLNVEYAEQDLKQLRQKNCYPERAVYLSTIGDAAVKSIVDDQTGEKSEYFRLRTQIRVGTAEFVLYSLLFREANNKVRTVQRSFGSE
jgi:general secretion pathway protein K